MTLLLSLRNLDVSALSAKTLSPHCIFSGEWLPFCAIMTYFWKTIKIGLLKYVNCFLKVIVWSLALFRRVNGRESSALAGQLMMAKFGWSHMDCITDSQLFYCAIMGHFKTLANFPKLQNLCMTCVEHWAQWEQSEKIFLKGHIINLISFAGEY